MTLVRAEIPAAQKRNWKPLIFPLAATVLNLGALALWLTLPSCVTPENSGWMGRFALCIVVQSVSLCAAIGSIVSAASSPNPLRWRMRPSFAAAWWKRKDESLWTRRPSKRFSRRNL